MVNPLILFDMCAKLDEDVRNVPHSQGQTVTRAHASVMINMISLQTRD